MFKRLITIAAIFCLTLIPMVRSAGDTLDTTARLVTEMRVWPDGTLTFIVSPAVSASGCQYPQAMTMAASNRAYRLSAAYALSAYTSHRKINLTYNGCTGPGTNGNVNLTSVYLPAQ